MKDGRKGFHKSMRNKFKSFISMTLATLLLLTMLIVSASAAEARASDLILNRSCIVTAADSGKIAVNFSVTTSGIVSRLGAQSMKFYSQNGSSWTFEDSYGQYDSGMSISNNYTFDNTVYYQGTSGVKYKVVVTLFATNSSGTTDTRNYTLYVTA